ncbi:Putative protein of unknown function [Podospora comata]|uniref:Uncharacterized protein n=1 Tax=Podospora comata TaxID=48703 RepID=A0ABY6RU49_PODCO|nr:Putative protein of unknown function [Podospora comata]
MQPNFAPPKKEAPLSQKGQKGDSSIFDNVAFHFRSASTMPHQDKTQSREHKPPPGKWSVLGSLGGSWTSAWYHRLLVKVASLSQEDDISTPNSVPVRRPRFRPNLSATRDQLLHSQVLPLEPSTTDDPTGHQIDGWAWLLPLRLRMWGIGG